MTRTLLRSSWLAAALLLATAVASLAATFPVASKTLTVFRTCVLTGTSAATAVADTYVDQSAGTVNSNFNGATTMSIRSGNNTNRRAYLSFDLTRCSPAIPSTATVELATLRLYLTLVPGACRTHDVFKLASAWTASAITWNNQPVGTSINNPPTAQRTSSATVGTSPCTYSTINQYVSWPVTADVAAFVVTPSTNHGWMIRDDAEGAGTARTATYTSMNAAVLTQADQLIVNYVT